MIRIRRPLTWFATIHLPFLALAIHCALTNAVATPRPKRTNHLQVYTQGACANSAGVTAIDHQPSTGGNQWK